MKYLDAIVGSKNNLAELVYDTLRWRRFFHFIIGGDHCSVGKCFRRWQMLWRLQDYLAWRLCGDINTNVTSPNGKHPRHAVGVHSWELGSEELVNVYAPGNKVAPQNVFLVGTRSLDEGESELIKREHLSCYTMDAIREKASASWLKTSSWKLKERKIRNVTSVSMWTASIHTYAPGTGTRVDNGLSPDQCFEFIDHILYEFSQRWIW